MKKSGLLFLMSILLFACNKSAKHFKLAIAEPLRHTTVDEIKDDLKRFAEKGYNAVYLENDYVTWTWEKDPDAGFGGNWKLFNIYDFTRSKNKAVYKKYLDEFCNAAGDAGLDVYMSFWIPKLNTEFEEDLNKNNPDAFGTYYWGGKYYKGLCMCDSGSGRKVLADLVEQFMREYPKVKGLKIGTIDNSAVVCDSSCKHAHGSSHADHVANLYKTIQDAMLRVRPDAKLIVYYWHWEDGYLQNVCSKLKKPFLVGCKVEKKTQQSLEPGIPGEPIWDASILTEKVGADFMESIKYAGAENVIDMTPIGTGIDDFFIAAPSYPGRIYRRFKILDSLGSPNFMDFECGAHHPGSGEEAVSLYNRKPDLSEEDFLKELAGIMYQNPDARINAVKGWKAFDKGFGFLPVGLGNSGTKAMSGRFGMAWTMCLGTPMVQTAFTDTCENKVHWFSPYNFFTTSLSPRIKTQFMKVLPCWIEGSACLSAADSLEGHTQFSSREALVTKAQVIALRSALNWCEAALAAKEINRFRELCKNEIEITRSFTGLINKDTWVWDNNCWHPHQTLISQLGLGYLPSDRNTFDAKFRIMNEKLK